MPENSAHRTQGKSVQSVLQQKLRGKLENINLLRGPSAELSVEPLITTTEEEENLKLDSESITNILPSTSESASEEGNSYSLCHVQSL
ncbi:hypothetical protein L9F63_013244 [Diploptera punctata]|uniref:Uncharacterized protein n=1 Tax=Diploptera punctata TaxID=6984 RepID=A0AAD8ABF8_DIPPU|nr:hypothetical protein L9F63_013244 [Diploptera punctata]